MSWSITIGPYTAEEWAKVARPTIQDAEDTVRKQQPDCQDEAIRACDAAIDAAKALIASGALGSGATFLASLNGHANPGNRPREGWSNDYVTVNLYQR